MSCTKESYSILYWANLIYYLFYYWHIILKEEKDDLEVCNSLKKLHALFSREESLVWKANLCSKCSSTTPGSLPSPALCLEKASGDGCCGQGRGVVDLLPMNSSQLLGRIEPFPVWLSLLLHKGGLNMRGAHNCT